MTFSIVARDDATGAFGVCGHTTVACYGALVPQASLRGSVATQAYVSTDNALAAMQLLSEGHSAEDAMRRILATDPDVGRRQLLMIGRAGRAVCWTGDNVVPRAGYLVFDDHGVAGNSLKSLAVLEAMSACFSSMAGTEFALRLIRSVQAGQQAGGEIDERTLFAERDDGLDVPNASPRAGAASAAVLIASPRPAYWHNLRVDASPDALEDLETLYRQALEVGKKMDDFYDGAIEIKPYYWRVPSAV
jgi:uncharacterized Ntn-hydrolase superfamily protein